MKEGQVRVLQSVFTFTAGLMILIGILLLFNNYIVPSMSEVSLENKGKSFLSLMNTQISKTYEVLKADPNSTIITQVVAVPRHIDRKTYVVGVENASFSQYFKAGGRGNWRTRQKLEVIEPYGEKGDYDVVIRVPEKAEYRDIRISEGGDKEIEWDNVTNSRQVVFELSLNPNQVRRDIYLYYNNTKANLPSYVDNVNLDGRVLNASLLRKQRKSRVCLRFEGFEDKHCRIISAAITGSGKAQSRSNFRIKGVKKGEEIYFRLSNV